jgi:hypothetical protein
MTDRGSSALSVSRKKHNEDCMLVVKPFFLTVSNFFVWKTVVAQQRTSPTLASNKFKGRRGATSSRNHASFSQCHLLCSSSSPFPRPSVLIVLDHDASGSHVLFDVMAVLFLTARCQVYLAHDDSYYDRQNIYIHLWNGCALQETIRVTVKFILI